ncbi:hypothetical protein [Stutzerimonas stutzeri]|uniref:hypothetical protein n=1 Tax=Stutzerimonas stutzeri TaxID=316 RepID=UPI0011AECC50|nr:hypothetical protein [Stutzerimonas stutzeri]MCQ4254569.1 hypothetical protein [Stutzerimonas stutzeri]
MPRSLSETKRQLLLQMESILGNECYNAHIQNYGPNGVREAAGRSFRYPITLRSSDGSKIKTSESIIPATVSDEMIRSGYYAFGANQLDVMAALEKILQHLEENHGLVLDVKEN